jgi:hypothetical protein
MNTDEEKVFHTTTDVWTDKIEDTLKEIGESCTGYKWMNLYAAKKTLRKYNILMYSSIVIGPISGILSAVASKYEDYADRLGVVITIFGFLSGLFSAIIKFSKLGDKSSSYKTVSAKYASLEGNIRRQLLLGREDRVNAGEYLEWISTSFDELFTSAPLVSDNIYSEWVEYARKNGMTIPKELGRFIEVDEKKDCDKATKLCNIDKIQINRSPKHKNEINNRDNIKLEIKINDEVNLDNTLTKTNRSNISNQSGSVSSKNRHKVYEPTEDLTQYSESRMMYELKRLNTRK